METNKIIAEFMDLKRVPCKIGTTNGVVNEGYMHPEGCVPFTPSGLQYKYSWDWLMPVVERCYDEGSDEKFVGDITHGLLDCDIDSTYMAVVKFIKTL